MVGRGGLERHRTSATRTCRRVPSQVISGGFPHTPPIYLPEPPHVSFTKGSHACDALVLYECSSRLLGTLQEHQLYRLGCELHVQPLYRPPADHASGRMGYEMANNLFSKVILHQSSDYTFNVCDASPDTAERFKAEFIQRFPAVKSVNIVSSPQE